MEHLLEEQGPEEPECLNCVRVLKLMIIVLMVILVGLALSKHGILPVPFSNQEVKPS